MSIAVWGRKYYCPDCGCGEAEVTVRVLDCKKMLSCPACGKEYVIVDDTSSPEEHKRAEMDRLLREAERGMAMN